MAAIATEHNLPTENLLAPDSIRRLAWSPPDDVTEPVVADVLRGLGARQWQVQLTAAALAEALVSPAAESSRSSPHLPPSPTIWLGKPYLPRSEGPFACSPTTSSACARASRRR